MATFVTPLLAGDLEDLSDFAAELSEITALATRDGRLTGLRLALSVIDAEQAVSPVPSVTLRRVRDQVQAAIGSLS